MRDLKAIGQALLLIAVVLAILIFGHKIYSWREGAKENDARKEAMETTGEVLQDTAQADRDRSRSEEGVLSARVQYDRTTQEAEKTDEELRDWRAVPVPDSVRRSAHQRRLARERSASDGGQPEKGR